MTDITGLLIQSEFASDVDVTDIEVIIDSAIDTVNSDAGTSIGYMTGPAGSKTITVTGNEAAAIKPMVAMKLISRSTAGASSTSTNIGALSTSQSASSSTGDVNADQYIRAIDRLRGRYFDKT
jgi:outer membrane PBP1 activator LpoA protein